MSSKKPLAELLSTYQPKPGQRFDQRMKQAPWAQGQTMMDRTTQRTTKYLWQFVALTIIVLIGLSLSISDVRASLSAWLGLSVAPSNQMPVTAVTLIPVTPTIAETMVETTPTITIQPTDQIVQETETVTDSTQPTWDVLLPEQLPDGYQLQSEYFDTNHQMDSLTFTVQRALPGSTDPSLTTTKTITLLQALHNDFVPMQIAPQASTEDVQIGGQTGVYVVGAWDSEFVPDSSNPNGGQMVSTWRNDLNIQNLFWQVGDVYLVVITDDESLTIQDLISVAGSIR